MQMMQMEMHICIMHIMHICGTELSCNDGLMLIIIWYLSLGSFSLTLLYIASLCYVIACYALLFCHVIMCYAALFCYVLMCYAALFCYVLMCYVALFCYAIVCSVACSSAV